MKSFPSRPLLLRFGACWLTILAALTSQSSIQAGDLSVTGDLGVSGVLDVNGNAFNFGSWADNPASFGLGMTYAEDASHSSTVILTTTRSSSGWLWQKAAPNNGAGSVPQMRLSAGNIFTLYDQATPTPNAKIVLDPVGTSSFSTSVTFNGITNLMPYQTLSGNNAAVLTVSLADSRYLTKGSGNQLTVGPGASANGTNAVALGYNASGNNIYATALGGESTASGISSTALGYASTASGYISEALGYASVAYGDWTTALGVGATAHGTNSLAVGAQALATGVDSTAVGRTTSASNLDATAFGIYSTASGWGATTLGTNSVASGDRSTALGFQSGVSAPAATAVGFNSAASGIGAVALGSYSNASGNYATALTSSSAASGDYAVSAGLTNASSLYTFTVGAYGSIGGDPHAWNDTDELFVVGNGRDIDEPSNAFVVKKNGDTEVQGNLTVDQAIIVQPQGDLQMGEFTAHPSPTP